MRDLVDKYSSALPLARATLRILIVLNWLFGAAVLALLVATIVAEQWTFTALGIAPSSYLRPMMMGLRAIAALGVVTVPLNYAVLKRLRAMVETVRNGDPFVSANADRLQTIAWVLLALQILSLVIGGIGHAISTSDHPLHLDAGFPTNGWLAVILTFVLARVFAKGALMREDLEGTV
jgi:ABC-type transport system involved in multi-copper enzyme maturation permease subunit